MYYVGFYNTEVVKTYSSGDYPLILNAYCLGSGRSKSMSTGHFEPMPMYPGGKNEYFLIYIRPGFIPFTFMIKPHMVLL